MNKKKLIQEIAKLLEKHEVHNEVLAIEIAILVLQHQKTQLKIDYRVARQTIKDLGVRQ